MLLAIDPGPKKSALVEWDGKQIISADIYENDDALRAIRSHPASFLVIEQVVSYGMKVGTDVFETVFWSGRFAQAWQKQWARMPRMDVKMHLCHSPRAKDSNVITALVDRFDPDRKYGKYGKGTKPRPGLFYGFSKDIWQAFALAITYWDKQRGEIK